MLWAREVVLEDDKERQLPFGGDVQGFVNDTLAESAVADENDGDFAVFPEFAGEGSRSARRGV